MNEFTCSEHSVRITYVKKSKTALNAKLTDNKWTITSVNAKQFFVRHGGRTFQVSGTKLWNTIPTNIKKKSSYNSFYEAIRSFYYNR